MRQMLWIMLLVAAMSVTGCGSQEQPAKPAAPVATTPAQPAAPPPAPVPHPAVIPPAAPTPAVPVATEAPKPPAAPVAAKPAAPAEAKPAATVPAAAPAKPAAAAKPPTVADTLVLEASQGKVTLPHLAHAKMFPCATCHGEATPGKIGLTKDTAHALCRDCHKAKGAGPTACGDCHKK